jgi:exodeoxyribonuclease VII small subunit
VSRRPDKPTPPAPTDAPPADFESAVAQIEKIIERIESGEIGLEESIAQYETGVNLIRRCRQVLDRAEQRVEELTGQMQDEAVRSQPAPAAKPPQQEPGF